jgi:hypothetical protein
MDTKKIPSSYTIFLPSKLNLEEIIKSNPPNFKYKIEEGLYILHLIGKLSDKKASDLEAYDNYARPHSAIMQRKVRDYRKWLDYFIQNNILIESRHYEKGRKSRGFRFTNHFMLIWDDFYLI